MISNRLLRVTGFPCAYKKSLSFALVAFLACFGHAHAASMGDAKLPPLPDVHKPAFIMHKIQVFDLDRSISFYTEALGMDVLARFEPPDAGVIEIIIGYGTHPEAAKIVLLFMADRKTPLPEDDRFNTLIFQTPDLSAACERIKKLGGKITTDVIKIPDMKMQLVFAKDPDGHVLELIQRE